MVFALSITPKRFLHNIFAKHIDNKTEQVNYKPYQVSHSGYNCDNDNLVAESNFVGDQNSFSVPLFSNYSAYLFKNISFSSFTAIYSPLRGPPHCI